MNLFLRAAVAALTGAAVLLAAACSSPTTEAAPPPSVGSTASAWVKPVESVFSSTSSTSAALTDTSSPGMQSSPETPGGSGSDPYFSASPLPAGLTSEDQQQIKAAIEAYGRYWSLTNRVMSDPTIDWSQEITAVATGTAATALQDSVTRFKNAGQRVEGAAAVVVTVQRVDAGAVDLQLCVDGSKGRVVDLSGAIADEGVDTHTRRPGSARVGEYTTGWKVDTNAYDMASSC